MGTANLILGDCIEKMKELEANSIDAVITDPPYGLEFMGKEWDKFDNRGAWQSGTLNDIQSLPDGNSYKAKGFGVLPAFRGMKENDMRNFQEFNCKWATQALRVLKPGGFMFAMGGTRTHHRLTCGIEDAGFMIRDELCWVYMQGFPKAQDLGMLIEKKLGGEGEDTGVINPNTLRPNSDTSTTTAWEQPKSGSTVKQPTLPLAKEWQGWKTPALKPAFEPIVVAQKPCEGSITENVMKNGVGGYNIDECRIEYENKNDTTLRPIGATAYQKAITKHGAIISNEHLGYKEIDYEMAGGNEKGRYPSNLLMQEECFGKLSKYFLIPKASKGEKEENLDEFPDREIYPQNNSLERKEINATADQKAKNHHPTVKPIALMQHLIKLTTKPGYTVLDPFLGSGTTAVAALNLNRNVVGIELNEEYMKIAKARISEEAKQTRLF